MNDELEQARDGAASILNLWRLMAARLVQRLEADGPVSTEILHTTRRFIHDHREAVPPPSGPRQVRRLRELQALYMDRLKAALRERPSASLFAEARLFLAEQGFNEAQPAAPMALQDFGELPFRTSTGTKQ